MIVSIILAVAFLVGLYLIRKTRYTDEGIVMFVISGVFLGIYSIAYMLSGMGYTELKIKRDVLENTLIETRKSDRNDIERATILISIVKVNSDIKLMQYRNKNIFIGNLIDNRVDSLTLIGDDR